MAHFPRHQLLTIDRMIFYILLSEYLTFYTWLKTPATLVFDEIMSFNMVLDSKKRTSQFSIRFAKRNGPLNFARYGIFWAVRGMHNF